MHLCLYIYIYTHLWKYCFPQLLPTMLSTFFGPLQFSFFTPIKNGLWWTGGRLSLFTLLASALGCTLLDARMQRHQRERGRAILNHCLVQKGDSGCFNISPSPHPPSCMRENKTLVVPCCALWFVVAVSTMVAKREFAVLRKGHGYCPLCLANFFNTSIT